ncbi:MAG TPA: acetate--CoA ligase family protein [Lentibacillus sp.]|uniref:acetate--CoA ligase family protein n=1 Tax=Lentibacillus sp. TaxID=1925746 RepID=UPI002B4B7934|nr:acetate--CoA ligase family protein [Lentibacillus sp.]HLR62388.1 acetate--CoA ligase family protein [Lentibacillus sp.]
MEVKLENLKRMLKPRHIVFIGNKNIVRYGVQNCEKMGFQGRIYAVNKTEVEIEGVRCYKSINELPLVPDAAFIAIRGDRAIDVIRELRTMGVFGCVCYAAGFSEIGNNQLHKDLIEASGDMALVGPNCYGIINFLDQVPLWPDRYGSQPTDKGVAIISQSGNLSFNMTMNDRSLPLAYTLSIGNQTVLDIADYMMVMCDDPRVTAIGLHIEGLADLEKFILAAKTALERGVPVVAFKTGVSEIGSQLTMSHTSSLAGSDDLYKALFKRLNICRVDSLSGFLETLKLFSVAGSLKGRKLGVLTVSGGESAITADVAAENEFSLPSLNAEQREQLESQLTTFEHVSNPLDYNMSIWGDEEKLIKCFTTFMRGQFHTTLLILDFLDMDKEDIQPWLIAINSFIHACKQNQMRALVISVLPEGLPAQFRKKLISNGITPLQGMTDAFIAITAVTEYNERKKRNFPISTNLLVPKDQLQKNRSIVLDEWQGKQELHSFGLKIPFGKIVSYKDNHLINKDMNGPFVIKGISTKLIHKTDVGAVKLNLQTEEEVRLALLQMHRDLAGQIGEGMQFLVEEMMPGAVAELNLGIKRDDQFGLALVISMGGELVNLVNDSVPILLPASREEILEALYSLKGIKLLKGFRGRPKGDIEAVVKAAESVAKYAEANRNNIFEMDINPLLVFPEGQGAVAVDAFIRTVINPVKTIDSSIRKENLI